MSRNKWLVNYEPVGQRLDPEALALFVLPRSGAALLAGLSDWLTWRDSYRDNFTDTEWAEVEQLAHRTRGALMSYITLEDVHSEIVLMREALQALAGGVEIEVDGLEPLQALDALTALAGILQALDPEIIIGVEIFKRLAQAIGAENLPTLPSP